MIIGICNQYRLVANSPVTTSGTPLLWALNYLLSAYVYKLIIIYAHDCLQTVNYKLFVCLILPYLRQIVNTRIWTKNVPQFLAR